MALWKIIDYDTGDDLLFCSRQCAEDYMVVHDSVEEDDLHELDPTDEDDAILIEECTPSSCDQCRRRIEKEDS